MVSLYVKLLMLANSDANALTFIFRKFVKMWYEYLVKDNCFKTKMAQLCHIKKAN